MHSARQFKLTTGFGRILLFEADNVFFFFEQRVKKENAMAERFWATRKSDDLLSEVSVRTNATSRSTDTTVLKARLEALESELAREREYRQKVESDLKQLRSITEE